MDSDITQALFIAEKNRDISFISISITMHEDGQMETKTIPTYGIWLIGWGWCGNGSRDEFLTPDINKAYAFREELATLFPTEIYEVREYS